jgi:F0F1-type ATP synthase assembly protein I
MDPSDKQRRDLARAYGLSALGFTLGGAVVVFTGIGWLLDKWLHTVPLFTIAAAMTGAVLGFLNVYFRIRRDETDRRERRGR